MKENEIASLVFDAGLEIHRTLGPGLLESAYQECLVFELRRRGLQIEKQVSVPLKYKEVHMEAGYRLDILVEKKVILEVKSVEALQDIHIAQILTYLRLYPCKLGLLINFNTVLFKDGFKRMANGL
jgi:GxxExxY protein